MLLENPVRPAAAWRTQERTAEVMSARRGLPNATPSGCLKGARSVAPRGAPSGAPDGTRSKTRSTLPNSAKRVKFCDGLTINPIINRGNDI